MCIDNFIYNIKKHIKVEISRADFEELVKAYIEYKELKESFDKLHFLSGIPYGDLKQINWTAFSYMPVDKNKESVGKAIGGDKATVYRVQVEGEFTKTKGNKEEC